MGKRYTRDYYEARQQRTRYSARVITDILLQHCAPVHSAVDVGCGVGTWLAELSDKGVAEIQGVDGPWVEQDLLVIPPDRFLRANLGEPVTLPRRYDLAISLEVAEHLPCERAEGFVAMLTGFADQVLFSAAIPKQGGGRHINERWQSWWVELFSACGYDVHDFIRARIWNDEQMPYWYRQNTLFFSRRGLALPAMPPAGGASMPLDVVHPVLFEMRARRRRRLRERLLGLLRRDGSG